MDIRVVGSASGNLSEVDSNDNQKIIIPTTQASAPFLTYPEQRVTENFRADFRQDTNFFSRTQNDGANTSLSVWQYSSLTSNNNNGLTLFNSSLANAGGTNAYLGTYKTFRIYKGYTTRVEMNFGISFSDMTSVFVEWGLVSTPSSTNPAIDGVMFRIDRNGDFYGCMINNGSMHRTESLNYHTLVGDSQIKKFRIDVTADTATFYIEGAVVATLTRPDRWSQVTSSLSHNLTFKTYNNASSSRAAAMLVADAGISYDIGDCKPASHHAAAKTLSTFFTPATASGVVTALYTNSLAAGAGAVMTNTTAALGNGLGGQFSAQPSLAVPTDGIVCAYSAPTVARFFVTGIRIQGAVTTALTGGAVIYEYAALVGCTSVAINISETGTQKTPRRRPLGTEVYEANAPLGTIGQGVYMSFDSPLAVDYNNYFHITAKNVGTVTSAGVITFLVTIDGYWE